MNFAKSNLFGTLALIATVCAADAASIPTAADAECLAGTNACELLATNDCTATVTAAETNRTAEVQAASRTRNLTEAELLPLLTATLQDQVVKDRGVLELRLARPWAPVTITNEPMTVRVLDLPLAGITPSFILRFELVTASGQRVGPWQAALQAKVLREVWVAHSALKRGESPRDADIALERRDILPCREAIADFNRDNNSIEVAETVSPGSVLCARHVKARPVVHRGETVTALLEQGALSISMKAEVLEEGAPGQIIRIRNSLTRRDLRGKVLNEQTILIFL